MEENMSKIGRALSGLKLRGWVRCKRFTCEMIIEIRSGLEEVTREGYELSLKMQRRARQMARTVVLR
jgi:hypothetical protein